MKLKNTRNAGIIALSLFALSGLAPLTNAGVQMDAAAIDDTQDAKAVEIIEASIEAMGGRELIENGKYMTQKGTMSIPMAGLSGTMESYSKSPDKVLLVMTLAGFGESRTGLNDGVAWSMDVMSGPRLLSDEEAKGLIEESDPSYRLNFKDRYPTIELVGEVEYDGSKANKIKLIDKDGNESIEYYSAESKLQVGKEQTSPSPMGPVNTVTTMRDYKEFDGMMIACEILQKIGPNEIHIVIKDTSFEKFDESVFEMPAAIKALVEAQKEDD